MGWIEVAIAVGKAVLDSGDDTDEGRIIGDTTANINASLDHVTGVLAGLISQGTDTTGADIDDLYYKILSEIQTQTGQNRAALNASTDNIVGRVNSSLLLLNAENDVRRGIIEALIKSNAKSTQDIISGIIQRAILPVLVGNSDISNSIGDLDLKFNIGFTTINSGVQAIVDLLAHGINANIENNVIIEDSVFDLVLGKIDTIVGDVIQGNTDTLDSITTIFSDVINDNLEVSNAIALEQAKAVGQLPDYVKIGNENEEFINGVWVDKTLEGMGGTLFGSAMAWFDENKGMTDDELQEAAVQAIFGGRDPQEVMNECNLGFGSIDFIKRAGQGFMGFFGTTLALLKVPLAMADIQATRQMQFYRKCFPDALMQAGDLASSFHRGLISGDKAISDLRKQGLTGSDAADLLSSAYRIPELQFLFSMWYRDELDEDGLDYALESHGFNPAWIKPLKEIAWFIPPVNDLVTMAVREVFSEEISRANGQFDEFPEDFATYAKKQGVNREWAERYWAAHWRLPSEQMGFEMFHRQEIDEARLKQLMVALDVMPGWRDEMIAISYNTLTRVDVRRMHAMEVLTDDQTLKAYRDMGYSPDNAELMLQFTKEYNSEGEILTFDVASDLTRSNIIGFYKDGILNEGETLALLIQAGINVAAAELFVMAADFDIERKDRKQQKDLILEQYEFGIISYSQAVDFLNSLDVEPRERQLALLELEQVKVKLTKLPSRTDLDKFIGEKLIDKQTYLDTMESHGYSPEWSNRYLALATKVKSNDT